jgi:hypothetical protein
MDRGIIPFKIAAENRCNIIPGNGPDKRVLDDITYIIPAEIKPDRTGIDECYSGNDQDYR